MRQHPEGFDWHRRVAAPLYSVAERVIGRGKVVIDRAPDEIAVEQNVAAMGRMDKRVGIVERVFRIDDRRQILICDENLFGGVFRDIAIIRDDGRDPLAGVSDDA